MRIDPILIARPFTGAVRHITVDLLRATYRATLLPAFDVWDALEHEYERTAD